MPIRSTNGITPHSSYQTAQAECALANNPNKSEDPLTKSTFAEFQPTTSAGKSLTEWDQVEVVENTTTFLHLLPKKSEDSEVTYYSINIEDNGLQYIFDLTYFQNLSAQENNNDEKIEELSKNLEQEKKELKSLFTKGFSAVIDRKNNLNLPSEIIDKIQIVAAKYKELDNFLVKSKQKQYLSAKTLCKEIEEYFMYLQLNIVTKIITENNIQKLDEKKLCFYILYTS